jgi:hypothetical protein
MGAWKLLKGLKHICKRIAGAAGITLACNGCIFTSGAFNNEK